MRNAWRKLRFFAKIPGTAYWGRLLKFSISLFVAFSTYHLVRIYYLTYFSLEISINNLFSIILVTGSFILLNFSLAIVFGLTFLRDDISKLISGLNNSEKEFNSREKAYNGMMEKFFSENQVYDLANTLLKRISEFLILSKALIVLLNFSIFSSVEIRGALISAFSGAAFAWAIIFYIYPYGE
jgi:hypothetical protein